jgi:hypothetical protein
MSALPKLFEIASQFHALAALGDDDDLPPEVIRDTLEALEGDLALKCEQVAKFVLGLEAEADAIFEAAAKMKARAERRQRRAEAVRAYMLLQLQISGQRKIVCPEFTIAVRANPEAVEIENLEDVPEQFRVIPEPQPWKPDKKGLLAVLKAGAEIPGIWIRKGEHMEIRT